MACGKSSVSSIWLFKEQRRSWASIKNKNLSWANSTGCIRLSQLWGMHRLDCEKSESHSSVIVISASFTLLTFIQSNCKLLLFIWFHMEFNGYCQIDSFKDWSLSLWPKIPPGIFRKEWQDGVSWQTLGSPLSYWHSKPRTHPTKCCSFHLQSLFPLMFALFKQTV